MDISENIKKFYREKYYKYGISPQALSWVRRGAAHQRFRQFWAEIDFSGKTVLDVGCGFGELGNFLTKRYTDVKYLGIDIVPEFIAEGKKLYPHLKLKVEDYQTTKFKKKFEVVIASGILNSNTMSLRGPEGRSNLKEKGIASLSLAMTNINYRKNAIEKLFSLTSHILAFNMLGGYPQPENRPDSNVWYADSLEILKYCLTLTPRVILRHHYHLKDFTIIMYKTKNDASIVHCHFRSNRESI